MTTSTAHSWKSPTIGILQQEIGILLHKTISNHCHPLIRNFSYSRSKSKPTSLVIDIFKILKKNSNICANRSKLCVGKPSQFRNPKRLRLPKRIRYLFELDLENFWGCCLLVGTTQGTKRVHIPRGLRMCRFLEKCQFWPFWQENILP